ncbi:hypothetical protein [Arthrobacter sp. HS15c]|uniref:hypothetical protein n=1 Tax=Arthrobacter sp. HS15c TaxID=3230279 RepID=UPI003467202E
MAGGFDGPEIDIQIEPGSLRRLVQASRTWDKVARRDLRANLRAAADPAMADVRAEVQGPTPPKADQRSAREIRRGKSIRTSAARARNRNIVRQALASGVRSSIKTGRVSKKTGDVSGEGIRIEATKKKLPAGQEPMLYLYGRDKFRHPVFGDTETWVNQRGKPWFYRPISKHRNTFKQAVVDVIDAAAREIGSE